MAHRPPTQRAARDRSPRDPSGKDRAKKFRVWVRYGLTTLGASALAAACNGEIVLTFAPDSGTSNAGNGCGAACTSSVDGGTLVGLVGNEANGACAAPSSWLPATPPVAMMTYSPHPDTECPFYQGAYQNFLIATQPQSNGDPALVGYATLDDAFTSTLPHAPRNTSGRAWLTDVRQSGNRNVLIDRDHHAIYYGLHMNQAFVDFIQTNHLETVAGILNVDPALSFPPGLVEIKTAWQDIDPQDFPNSAGAYGTPDGIVPAPTSFASDPGDYSNYITTSGWLPALSQNTMTGLIDVDANHPVLRKIALVAVDLGYTLPGHPELIWATVQHVNVAEIDPAPLALSGLTILGMPDTQPYGINASGQLGLPLPIDPNDLEVTTANDTVHDYLLYAHGTAENEGNAPLANNLLALDAATQSFPTSPESMYRMFPGSRATDLRSPDSVTSLNANVSDLWATAVAQGIVGPGDKRQNYRLVGALWLDKPYFFGTSYPGIRTPPGSPLQGAGVSFENDDGTNPLVIGVCGSISTGESCTRPQSINLYPGVSEGVFCGTPLDSTDTSGDSPNANASNNSVPGCVTRADLLDAGDNPASDFAQTEAGTTDPFSILGGADRLSSVAIDSFTQNGTFHNCFACHNTKPTNTNGTPYDSTDPTQRVVLSVPANINVSRLFSAFVLRDATEVCNAATIPCPGQLDAGALTTIPDAGLQATVDAAVSDAGLVAEQ